jgi:hypothetical protein
MTPIVNTLHILKTGEVISSLSDYEKVQEKFGWVNKADIVARFLSLRGRTENHKKSMLVIYEEGHLIREYLHVEDNFSPLLFC